MVLGCVRALGEHTPEPGGLSRPFLSKCARRLRLAGNRKIDGAAAIKLVAAPRPLSQRTRGCSQSAGGRSSFISTKRVIVIGIRLPIIHIARRARARD
jgi:hypothetical protein